MTREDAIKYLQGENDKCNNYNYDNIDCFGISCSECRFSGSNSEVSRCFLIGKSHMKIIEGKEIEVAQEFKKLRGE